MADEDIGGIKIGLTADTTQLKAAMDEADRLISKKAQNLRDRQITMNVFAKVDSATFGKIERDLNTVVKRAQERNAFKFSPMFTVSPGSIRTLQREMARASRQAGGIKLKVDLDVEHLKEQALQIRGLWAGWLGSELPQDKVKVKGVWDGWDGEGPPDVIVRGGGGGGPAPQSAGARRRRPAPTVVVEEPVEPQAATATRSRVKEAPKSKAHARPDADATGEAVAREIKESPVKTERAPKEKAETKAAPRTPAAGQPAFRTADEYIASPRNQEAIKAGRADEAMLRRVFEMSQAAQAEAAQKQADLESRLAKRGKAAQQATPKPVKVNAPEVSDVAASMAAAVNDPVDLDWDDATEAIQEAKEAVAAAVVEGAAKTAKSAAKEAASTAKSAANKAADSAKVLASNMEQQFLRAEEMPSATPLPETAGNQAVCPFCHQIFTKVGLNRHINATHKPKEGQTPKGYNREDIIRAQTTSGIGRATPESTLLREIFEERRGIGDREMSPDAERLFGVEKIRNKRPVRDRYGEIEREGGLLEKGLDFSALRTGQIRPIEGLSAEKTKALMEDPDLIQLQSDLEEAIEARRDSIKSELAEELEKVRHNPERSDARLKELQEAVADPTAGIGAEVGRRRARRQQRAQMGITDEALAGFRPSDIIRGRPEEATPRPEGFERLYNAYLEGQAALAEDQKEQQADLDKGLLRHKDASGNWNFGPDIELIRERRAAALATPEPNDFEGWMEHALRRGADPSEIGALREGVYASPEGERSDAMAKAIKTVRKDYSGPDPRALEEVRRLAFGPQPGEDISGMEAGDPRRTGLVARIRRAAVRGARNEGAKQGVMARFGRLFSPNNDLTRLRPREMEALEVAGYGAEASALLDIEDARRNTAQSTAQAADTRESNIEAKVAQAKAIAAQPEDRQEALRQAALKQAQEDQAKLEAAASGEVWSPTARTASAASIDLDPPVMENIAITVADLDALKALEENPGSQIARCGCGWTGTEKQRPFHERGNIHERWAAGSTGPNIPGFAGGSRGAGYNPAATPFDPMGSLDPGSVRPLAATPGAMFAGSGGGKGRKWIQEAKDQMVEFAETAGLKEDIEKLAAEGKLTARQIADQLGLHGGDADPKARLLEGNTGPHDPVNVVRAVREAAGIEPISEQIGVGVGAAQPTYLSASHKRAAEVTKREAARIEKDKARQAAEAAAAMASEESAVAAAKAEAMRITEDTPDVTVVGAAAEEKPPETRWCSACQRPISSRQWNRHIGSKPHKRNMQTAVEKTRVAYEDVAGVSAPADFEEQLTNSIEKSVRVPPPALARAMSGGVPEDLGELTANDLKSLNEIAQSEGGRKSLRSAGFSAEQVQQITAGVSARATPEGPTGAGAASAATARAAVPRIGASQLSKILGSDEVDRIRKSVEDDSRRLIESSEDIRQSGAAVLKENPVRALSVAVGQVLVQTIGGRAKLETQVKDLNRAVSREQQLIKRSTRLRGDLNITQAAFQKASEDGDTEQAETLSQDVQRRRNILARALRMQRTQRREVVDPIANDLQASRRRFALTTLGVGTVGIVAGTVLFTAAMTAMNAAIEQGTAWVGRMTDGMTGFATQANALAASMADASMETGRTEGTIRTQAGRAGLGGATADQLVDLITPRLTGEMAARRAVTMRDTLALGVQGIRDRAMHPGIENFAGVFQPTGGMVLPLIGQTNIGAQASVQETIASQVGNMPSNTLFDFMSGQPFSVNEALAPIGDAITNIFGGNNDQSRNLQMQRDAAGLIMGGFTEALQRGGSTASFINPTTQAVNRDLLAETAQANQLELMGGSPDLVNRIRAGDIALVDANGEVITSADGLAAAFDDLAQGLKTADLESIVEAGARQLEGALFGIATNLRNQLKTWNPIQTALQLAATPPMRFGTGVAMNLGGGGVPASEFGERAAISQGLRGELAERAAAGRSAMMQQAIGPGWGNPFTRTNAAGSNAQELFSTFNRIDALGQDIVNWQQQVADMQLDQQMAEYSRQVFVAERNISDLRGLVHGVGDAHASNIGIMQKENLERQRQIQDIQRVSEAASLAQSQRQLNFNLAVAGFTGGGATPAEAAAQMEQAQREAQFQQEQLDRQNQIFDITGEMIPNERAIVDEQNLRALEDALAEFQLFQDRFTLDQKTALIAQNIADAQALQGALSADMQDMLGSLAQVEATEIQMIQDAFNQGAETLHETAEVVKGVYADVASSFAREFNITISGTQGVPKGFGTTAEKNATGALFNTGGSAMGMIVGDAGNETVAILRNPRTFMGGGGGGSVQININNPVVRDESDISALARAVEDVLNRRARLYGMGR
jgi:hypothetical protein